MTETPVHDLQKALAAARFRAVKELAAKDGRFPLRISNSSRLLNAALSAVKDEIAEHEGRLGWGPATPLE